MNKLLKEQSDVAVLFFIAGCVLFMFKKSLKYSPTLSSESFLSRLFFKEREFIFLSPPPPPLPIDAYTYLETQKTEERKEISALHALDTSGEDQRPSQLLHKL